MAKEKKVSYVNVYKKLAKEKKEALAKKQEKVVAECGNKKEVYTVPTEKVSYTPERKEKGFKRDLKKLHQVWDFIKTNNLILKVFSNYVYTNGKKNEKPIYNRYVKFLHKDGKFWLINCNYIFDPVRVTPKNEIIGAHIYPDGNMQFTTRTKMFVTCEPYYGKKVNKDGKAK